MTSGGRNARDMLAPFGRSDMSLLSTPLRFIHAEHLRHREVCVAAEELAEAVAPPLWLAEALAEFLDEELARHVVDEEEDLFPMLRRRLKPADEAERIIGILSGEHAADETLAAEISAGLRAVAAGGEGKLSEGLRNALLTFADRQRRHLTLENAILLPLAERRLTRRDLTELARRMTARRGIRIEEGQR